MDREKVLYLLQEIYFDNIDSGNADLAVEAMHSDVDWVHTQVWEHDGHNRDSLDTLSGREELRAFLTSRIPEMQREGIEHKVRKVIIDGKEGAFQAQVIGPDGDAKDFFGWIELRDGKIGSYRVIPH